MKRRRSAAWLPVSPPVSSIARKPTAASPGRKSSFHLKLKLLSMFLPPGTWRSRALLKSDDLDLGRGDARDVADGPGGVLDERDHGGVPGLFRGGDVPARKDLLLPVRGNGGGGLAVKGHCKRRADRGSSIPVP